MKDKFIRFLLVFFVVCQFIDMKAQDFLPFVHDNYAGISGVHLQPASIADSRYRFDMTLAAASFNINNNFFSITKSDLFKLSKPREVLLLNTDKNTKYLFQEAQLQALGFMVSINPKFSFGITARVREFANADQVSSEIASFLYNKFDASALFGMAPDQNPSMSLSMWAEYGATLAGVIWDNDHHFVKAGLTVKLLQGLGAAYMKADIHQLVVKGTDSIGTNGDKINFNYGVSGDLLDNFSLKTVAEKINVGFDFGVVYEWRPKIDKYLYAMDGKINLKREDKNKYLLKAGVSLLDIGRIKYKKDLNSQDFSIQTEVMQYFNLNVFDNVKTIQDFNQTIDSLTSLSPNDPNYGIFKKVSDDEYYNMLLPSAISIQIDYNIWKNFYLNLSPYIAFGQKNTDKARVYALTSMALTPRYETSNFGISVPFQYNKISKLTVGLGLHLGPVWIGSNNLLGMLFVKDLYNANLSIGVKIPVKYKLPKDFDGDQVSDKMDKCKREYGVWENDGCPQKDSDDDLIPDDEDECPDTFGLLEFKGCPDSDNDNVPDHKDDCPDDFGFPEFNGCPDGDGDGVPDYLDECIDEFGQIALNGCPDSDGDGVSDHLDECPDIFGISELKGCPDSDGDGVTDAKDECPEIFGLPEFNGCPDNNNDAVPEKQN